MYIPENPLFLDKNRPRKVVFYGRVSTEHEARAEQKKLYSEKDRLYSSYNSAKSEIKELDMVMKNVDMILGKDKEKDRQRDIQRKRSGELE